MDDYQVTLVALMGFMACLGMVIAIVFGADARAAVACGVGTAIISGTSWAMQNGRLFIWSLAQLVMVLVRFAWSKRPWFADH